MKMRRAQSAMIDVLKFPFVTKAAVWMFILMFAVEKYELQPIRLVLDQSLISSSRALSVHMEIFAL